MPVTKSAAEVLATYLQGQGVALWPDTTSSQDWTITHHSMPNEGDTAADRQWIGVMGIGGDSDNRMRGDRPEYHRVQVRIRARTDPDALNKGKAICQLMDDVYDVVVTVDDVNHRLNHVERLIPTTFLKEEEKFNMRVYIINCFVRVTQE